MPMWTASQTTMTTGVLVAVIVLGLIEFSLFIIALVDLICRPAVRGGRKWVWIVVIAAFTLIGPIIYLAFGRVPKPVADDPGKGRDGIGDCAAVAADLLYGSPAGTDDAGDTTGSPPPPPPA